VDLVDSNNSEKKVSAVLLNVRNGTSGFVSLLDGVIVEEAANLEDLTE